MAEPRTPEEVAREWLAGRAVTRGWPVVGTVETRLREGLAALIRQERDQAFSAGVETGATHGYNDLSHPDDPIAAERRLAVEGRSDV